VIRYRPFRNTDLPLLAELWRLSATGRGFMQPMSTALLEQMVVCKPFFDRQGLIVAADENELVGFVHAGFGPAADENRLSNEVGVTCMLLTRPHESQATIANDLLAQSEDYLRRSGAKTLYGGGTGQLDPFYLGLYGGSEMPGVLASDSGTQQVYRSHGYQEIDRIRVFQLQLSSFRPLVDRRQLQIRRTTRLEVAVDPPSHTWWEACTIGGFERLRFNLSSPEGPLGTVTLWRMDPLAATWGVSAYGMIELMIDPTRQREGLATFLLGEAFRQLQSQGVTVVEAQAAHQNVPGLALYQKLGFREVDQGAILRKE
jgi:RimJ/RimL family protein N-acetyltransferase